MNRYDVVMTIRGIGKQFGGIMECLHGEEYAAGYMQAVRDMVRMFEYGPAEQVRPQVQKVVLFGGTRGHKR